MENILQQFIRMMIFYCRKLGLTRNKIEQWEDDSRQQSPGLLHLVRSIPVFSS